MRTAEAGFILIDGHCLFRWVRIGRGPKQVDIEFFHCEKCVAGLRTVMGADAEFAPAVEHADGSVVLLAK